MYARIRLMTAASMTAILFAGTACVTINIYFPAAAAEKAADRLIDDIWQLQGGTSSGQPVALPPPSSAPAGSTTQGNQQ